MSIEIQMLTVGPLATNCYILKDSAAGAAAIVDPGGDRDRIIASLEPDSLKVEWILLTHGHLDHSFYAGDLAASYEARIAMHESDMPMLEDGLGLVEMFYDMSEHVSFSPTDMLNDGDTFKIGESEIRVIHTPGHSPGGLCFMTNKGVLCGDTVFAGSVGRTDFPGGSHEQLVNSIKTQLLVLDGDTALYPGHGPVTTVGTERRGNPYLM